MRILPHLQDTGGFFVAVFEKVALLPWEKGQKEGEKEQKEGEKAEEAVEEKSRPEPTRKKRRMGGYKEDPFVFFKGNY